MSNTFDGDIRRHVRGDKWESATSDLLALDKARKRINLALIDINENDCPIQWFHQIDERFIYDDHAHVVSAPMQYSRPEEMDDEK